MQKGSYKQFFFQIPENNFFFFNLLNCISHTSTTELKKIFVIIVYDTDYATI